MSKENFEFPTPVVYRTGFPDAKDYAEAIGTLKDAMGQLEPDGRGCVICWDNDHQAFECRFNPLVMARRAVRQSGEWRCFHCDEVFTDPALAAEHFGEREKLNGKHDLQTELSKAIALVVWMKDTIRWIPSLRRLRKAVTEFLSNHDAAKLET